MTRKFSAETIEFLPIPFTDPTGQAVQSYLVCVKLWGERPGDWQTPASLDGEQGVMVSGLHNGLWTAWAKTVDNPESPVVNCGNFWIV